MAFQDTLYVRLSWSDTRLPGKEILMSVAHTSKMTIYKHDGPHRTALLEGFAVPIHFGIHGGIKHFYQEKYGRELVGPEYPATLDHMIAGVAG
jgi:hypothetical protein